MPATATTLRSNVVFLYVYSWGGRMQAVEVDKSKTALEIKKLLLEKEVLPEGMTAPLPEDIKLIWKGTVLENGHTLASHGVKSWENIILKY